ncbi:MAG: GNAT family protein [Trueperaceae bacterium]|nr:GNAT family protein [Trueperaceae bacterium]
MMIDHLLVLEGEVVRLEPLHPTHIPALMAIATATPDAFRYTSTPVTDAQRDAYFERAFRERDQNVAYPFAVFYKPTGALIGSTRFADLNWKYRNCELGFTWFAPGYQGTAVNPESKYLLLRYAFETLRFVRVQIHTHVANVQSQRAIRKLGAVYEGVLRNHMFTKDGEVRDTMVFSVIDSDWPEVKALLESRLEGLRSGETS